MKKIVVYSSIIGDYDKFYNHQYEKTDIDYILFTDNKNIKSENWEIVNSEKYIKNIDNSRASRFFKWNPHLLFGDKYEYSIWIDSSMEIVTNNFFNRIEDCIKNNIIISMARHPWRDNIYDEAIACKEQNKDTCENIDKLLEYIKNDYINDHNLFAGTMIFRKHINNNIIKFNEQVWRLILDTTKRDQLIFPYVSQKLNLDIFDFNLGENFVTAPEMMCYGTFWHFIHGNTTRDDTKYNFIYNLYSKNNELNNINNEISNKNNELNNKNNELYNEYNSIVKSKKYKILCELARIKKIFIN